MSRANLHPKSSAAVIARTLFLVAGLVAAADAGRAATAKLHRITLPGSAELPFPYTIEVPDGWTARQVPNDPGLWIGPADAKPNEDPHFIYVRISSVSLAEPEKVVAAIKQNDAGDDGWRALKVEPREVHGVRGVLVEIERGKDAETRTSLTLKMPLPRTSVDFVGQAKAADYKTLRPLYERILTSVAPAGKPAAPAQTSAKPPGR